MDFQQAKQDIIDWITTFVERPHPALNGWPPCPHARRTRMEGRLDIRPGKIEPYLDLSHIDITGFDIVAMVYDPGRYAPEEFTQQVQAVNRAFLIPRDLLALADHPACSEVVNGVSMNQGQWAIAFVQPLSKLDHFAQTIAQRGYYHGWPEDYLESLFEFRRDPRS